MVVSLIINLDTSDFPQRIRPAKQVWSPCTYCCSQRLSSVHLLTNIMRDITVIIKPNSQKGCVVNSVEYCSSPASVYHVTGSHGISIPFSVILDAATFNARAPSTARVLFVTDLYFHWKVNFFSMSVISDPATPIQKFCPDLPGKVCVRFLAIWDDHPLCTSCRCMAPKPCLRIFPCPTFLDWTEEQ